MKKDIYNSKEIKSRYSESEIAYMRKRDSNGYQSMTSIEQWAYDKRHGMLDF